ncbi:MAG: phosphotransferase [Candidatus Levybacteria bacterium]|nr:phosphotransferase [Candidatus Levybacteria bacterium]
MINIQSRIGYEGDLAPILTKAFENYNHGSYKSHSIVEMGYEDLNVVVETSHHKFFVKIFASFRDKSDCERYVEILERAKYSGVEQPEVYPTRYQNYIYETIIDGNPIRLIVMHYIDGWTLFDTPTILTQKEALFLIEQAAKINQISLKPSSIYDSWAIVNFLAEAGKKMQYLTEEDKKLVHPLIEKFRQINTDDLPHCFVHGDLIKTNIMRDKNDHLYILDFSVANCYPRIQEIAVLMCDVFFDTKNLDKYEDLYKQTLDEYQKYIPLEKIELEILPLYCQVAHAMHLLGATYEKKVNGNQTKENEYFLNLGRIGLQFTTIKQ